MALSESDKKKLPYLIALSVFVVSFGCYMMFFDGQVQQQPSIVPVKANQQFDKELSDVPVTPRPISLNENAVIQAQEVIEYTDGNGNPVQAIIEPSPRAITSERSLRLSEEDKEILYYLRSNLLLELQTKNELLKNEKDLAKKGGVTVQSNGSQSAQGMAITPNDLSGFSEVATVQPSFLANSMTPDQIEDAFDNVEVASIGVGGNDSESISAYIRVNGQLFQAIEGRKVGDFEIKRIKPNFIDIRYIPGNVTQTIGHSGFSG